MIDVQKTLFGRGFKAPFRASGLWVEDSRGENVCESTHAMAPLIAQTLNLAAELLRVGG